MRLRPARSAPGGKAQARPRDKTQTVGRLPPQRLGLREESAAIPKRISGLPSAKAQLALITASLDDDKAEDVVVVDLAGKASFADYMVIATGRSDRQVGAMADHLSQKLKAEGLSPSVLAGVLKLADPPLAPLVELPGGKAVRFAAYSRPSRHTYLPICTVIG